MTSSSRRPVGRASMYFIVNCSSQHRWPKVSTITHGENELSLLEGKNSFSTMKTDGVHSTWTTQFEVRHSPAQDVSRYPVWGLTVISVPKPSTVVFLPFAGSKSPTGSKRPTSQAAPRLWSLRRT